MLRWKVVSVLLALCVLGAGMKGFSSGLTEVGDLESASIRGGSQCINFRGVQDCNQSGGGWKIWQYCTESSLFTTGTVIRCAVTDTVDCTTGCGNNCGHHNDIVGTCDTSQ